MKEEEIARHLEELADSQMPGHKELWQSVRARVETQVERPREAAVQRRGLMFVLVPAIVVVIAIAILYVALTTMAQNQSGSLTGQPDAAPATQSPVKDLSVKELLDGMVLAETSQIKSFHGVQVTEHRNSPTGAFLRDRAERWYVAPDKARYDDDLTSETGDKGLMMQIQNGTSGWFYDSSLRSHKTKQYPTNLPSSFTPSSFNLILGDTTKILSMYNAKLLGVSTVAERTAHAVQLTIKPNSEWPQGASTLGGYDKVTIWIDNDTFFVLKTQTETKDGIRLSTQSYETFELNGTIDPAVFEVSPPEN